MISLAELKSKYDIDYRPGKWAIQYKAGGPWVNQKRELTDRQLQKHLDGEYWVATYPLEYARWCVLDFDNHGNLPANAPSALDRCKGIVRILRAGLLGREASELIAEFGKAYQSPRMGIHLYLRLKPWVKSETVQTVMTKEFAWFPVLQSYLEIFPLPGRILRLPHGKWQVELNV